MAFTVLGRFPGGDRLGRVVNLCERGLGAVFQGLGYRPEQPLEFQLVTGSGVRRGFGVICSAVPRGRHTRLGIRAFDYVPEEATGEPPRSRRRAVRADSPCGNPEHGFPLLSPGAARVIEEERRELGRDLRARYATQEDEPWPEVLRCFLQDLPASPLRTRFLREQFRAAMCTHYPLYGGSEIRGRLRPRDAELSTCCLPPCRIYLDHFAVACSDRSGEFVARSIPTLDDAMNLPLRVGNRAVLSTSPVAVHLPRLTTARFEVELPIVLRTSSANSPPRPQPHPGEDPALEHLLALVDQL